MTDREAAIAELEFRAQKIRDARDLLAACFDLINDEISSEEWLGKVAAMANCEDVSCIWWRSGRPETVLRNTCGAEFAISPGWIAKVDSVIGAANLKEACMLDEIPGVIDAAVDGEGSPLLSPTSLIACLDWEPARVIIIMKGRKDSPEWQDFDRHRFGNLLPVLHNSVAVKKKISWREDVIDLTNKIFDEMPRGFINVMPDRKVVSANKVAREVIDRRTLLQVHNGRLRFTDPKVDDELGKQLLRIQSLRDGDFEDYAWYRNLDKSSPASSVLLTMKAFRLDLWRREATPFDRIAVLIMDMPGIHSLPPQAQLREFYGLTPAQARVVQTILQDMSVEDAASKLNVSINTVRAHLRAIYARLGVTNKSQLLRVISATNSGRKKDSAGRT